MNLYPVKTTHCVFTFTYTIGHPHIHTIISNYNPHKHTPTHTPTHTLTHLQSHVKIPTKFQLFLTTFSIFNSFYFLNSLMVVLQKTP